MDFRLTPEQEALKKEFYEFFEREMKEASPGWLSSIEFLISEEGFAFHRRMAKKLAEKGWLTRHWPKEYGGQDAPIIEQLLFSEAVGYHRAVGVDPYGMELLAPTLFAVG
ncbi:MAG: acyl-CoA dehydrogenase, partial [Chloroflexi bacterium]